MGKKDEEHFSFEYPNCQGITTLIISTASSDCKKGHLLSIFDTPYMANLTSYVFNLILSDEPEKV